MSRRVAEVDSSTGPRSQRRRMRRRDLPLQNDTIDSTVPMHWSEHWYLYRRPRLQGSSYNGVDTTENFIRENLDRPRQVGYSRDGVHTTMPEERVVEPLQNDTRREARPRRSGHVRNAKQKSKITSTTNPIINIRQDADGRPARDKNQRILYIHEDGTLLENTNYPEESDLSEDESDYSLPSLSDLINDSDASE